MCSISCAWMTHSVIGNNIYMGFDNQADGLNSESIDSTMVICLGVAETAPELAGGKCRLTLHEYTHMRPKR